MPERYDANAGLAVRRRVDRLCDEFERAWLSGSRPRIDGFLPQIEGEGRAALLRELVALDCDFRRERGESPTLADYLTLATDSEGLLHELFEESPPSRIDRSRAGESSARQSLDDTHSAAPRPSADTARLPKIPGYELQCFLAQGGMGAVYRARDVKLGREVAIKTPRSGYIDTPQERERFLREAVAAARLRHPNICPVFEVRETADRPYIAMAFIRGSTLKAWRKDAHPAPRQLAELMARIARAVQAAHDQGVIHRDLKPSNVMVEEGTGEPILMDFGLAKDLTRNDGLTVTGDLIGTPSYMAPEQAAGRPRDVGRHSDVYSLGAILYELLADRAPFVGTLAEVLRHVQESEPASIRRSNPNVHRDLETICVKAMAKLPAERYESAGALAADLERFASGEPIWARRLTWWQRGWRRVQRHPLVSGLALSLVLALTVGAVATPALLRRYQDSQRNLQVSQQLARARQLTEQIDAALGSGEWTPAELPRVDRLAEELETLSPDDAGNMRRQITQRLERHLERQIQDAARMGEAEYAEVQASIASLAARDESLAAEWKTRAQERRAVWVVRTDLQPPFDGAQVPFRGLAAPGGELLVGADSPTPGAPPTRIYPTSEPSELNQKVTAVLQIPHGAEAGVVLNYVEMLRDGVGAIALAPDGSRFALSGRLGGAIEVWEVESRRRLFPLAGHDGGVRSLAFSPDGRRLVSSGADGHVRVWDLERRELHCERLVESPRTGPTEDTTTQLPLVIGVNARGNGGGEEREHDPLVYVGSRQGIERFWLADLTPLPPLEASAPNIGQLSISRDGRRLASSSATGQVQMWDLPTGRTTWSRELRLGRSARLALSGDGRSLAYENEGDILRVFDAATGQQRTSLHGQEGNIRVIAFDPGGRTVAVGYESAGLKLWDVETQSLRGTLHFRGNPTSALCFDAGGRWLLFGARQGLHQIDAAAVYRHWTWENQEYSFLVKRTPDGGQGEVRILRNGLPLRQLTQPLGPGPVTLQAEREHETLAIQVNQNPPVRLVDYFPPQPIQDGVWGVALSQGAGVSRVTASSSRAPAPVSRLERGDEQFRRGEFAAALEDYERQSVGEEQKGAVAVRQEAQLKRAICLQRLNRSREALECLQELSTTAESATPFVAIARFQWWLLLAQQGRWGDAHALASTIQAQHPYEAVVEVVPFDTQREIYALYAGGVHRRSSPFLAGSAKCLETAMILDDYLRWNVFDEGYLRWSFFEGYRIVGRDHEARELGLRIHATLLPILQETRLSVVASTDWNTGCWQCLGMLSRAYDRTEPIADALEPMVCDREGHVSPEVRGRGWELVLELARLKAAQDRWESTRQLLEQAERAFEEPDTSDELLMRIALLHGFALRRTQRLDEGLATWRRALAHPRLARGAADLETLSTRSAMEMIVLRGVAGEVDDSFVDQITRYLMKRLGGAGGAEQILKQFPIKADTLREMWRSPRGLETAELTARGDLLQRDQVKRQLMLYASYLVNAGALEPPTPEEEELLWSVAKQGYESYVADELSLATFLQLGLAWKGVPPPLGWTVVFLGVPNKIRGGVAYLLARRLERREQARAASTLYRMARDAAGEDATLLRLADERLKRLAE